MFSPSACSVPFSLHHGTVEEGHPVETHGSQQDAFLPNQTPCITMARVFGCDGRAGPLMRVTSAVPRPVGGRPGALPHCESGDSSQSCGTGCNTGRNAGRYLRRLLTAELTAVGWHQSQRRQLPPSTAPGAPPELVRRGC